MYKVCNLEEKGIKAKGNVEVCWCFIYIEELPVKGEVPCAHYLVENKIAWHRIHVLSDASHRPPCKAKPKGYN
jgi:hypothetical protein